MQFLILIFLIYIESTRANLAAHTQPSKCNLTFPDLANLAANLTLTGCAIQAIDTSTFNSSLPKLKYLDLSMNNISCIDLSSFAYMPSLTVLNLSGNPLVRFVASDSKNSSLHELDLGNTRLANLTDILQLSNLRRLSLRSGNVSHLHMNSASLISLQNSIRYEDLTGKSADGYFQARSIEELDLSHNLLDKLLELRLLGLTKLRRLNLAWNQIETIHNNSFLSLSHLRELILKGKFF
jgi:Leucine-rich repeat (LRR) protein